MSAAMVPKMLTMATVDQYTAGTYARTRNCATKAAASTRAVTTTAIAPPTRTNESDAASPIPWSDTLTTQNRAVTWGTLARRASDRVSPTRACWKQAETSRDRLAPSTTATVDPEPKLSDDQFFRRCSWRWSGPGLSRPCVRL